MANDESKRKGSKADEDSRESLLGDTLKKVFTAGLTGALLTEEGIRNYLGEVKLPKELLNIILQGAFKQKDELQSKLAKEINGVLQKIDWAKELAKIAENHKFKITAEIELVKKKKSDSDF